MKILKNIIFLFTFLLINFGFTACASDSIEQTKQACTYTTENEMPIIVITSKKLPEEINNNDFINLPVAVHVKEAEKEWGGTEFIGKPDPYYKDCKITVIDEFGTKSLSNIDAEVKVRGNWTTSYEKKALRIKFKEKQNILGLNEGNDFKNWVLLASYKDWSFMRDLTGFTIAKTISPNYYSSDFKLVEVYANKEYMGVYLLAEQQEVKKNRVEINNAEDNSSTETGYLIEFDSYFYTEDPNQIFTLNYTKNGKVVDRNGKIVTSMNNGYTIKNDLNNVAQRNFIKNHMQKIWDSCYKAVNDESIDSKSVASQYIDLQSLVDTYILSEIACDPDIYLTSFYMTIDFTGNKLLTFQAPWDFDSTMGNKAHDANSQGLFAGVVRKDVNNEFDGTGNPWLMLFVNEPWFQKMVKAKWDSVKDKAFNIAIEQIDYFSSKYATNFTHNYEKWKNIGKNDKVGFELRPEAAACKTQAESAKHLKKWLQDRKVSLEKGIKNLQQN